MAKGWFSESERTALEDFRSTYVDSWKWMQDFTHEAMINHPVFGPMIRAMPQEMLDQQNKESLERFERAFAGGWDEYEARIKADAAAYAARGLEFSAWYDIIATFKHALVPKLIERFNSDPQRLARVFGVMHRFVDHVMATMATAYITQKESRLKESEHDLSITLDSIGDAVIATDAAGLVTRMNPVAERLTGFPLAEAKGQPLSTVFHIVNEETGAVVESPVDKVLAAGVVVGLANHTALVDKNGSRVPIADSGAPIRDAAGKIRGVVLVFRDMTEEKAAERVRERARELERENVHVQEANRLKSEFLANMSHELRTPLNAILGFAELLQDAQFGPVNTQQAEFLGDILTSGRHLLGLINDVLDLAKVESGKLEFHPETMDVRTVVNEVVQILRTTAAQRRVKMSATIDTAIAEVFADVARFKQVLYNFLSNALKFTEPGGTASVRVVPDGARFRVEVQDSGIGIAEHDVPRLFQEFSQLDSGDARRRGGTGLGLVLTKRLVEAQGGNVGVQSPGVGKGSTFFALFPRTPSPEKPDQLSNLAPAAHGGARVVLVVDDNDDDRGLIEGILAQAGYDIDTAITGSEAVRKCKQRAYDAITLDLILPDGSGLDVLREVRSTAKNAGTAVIVLTVVTERAAVGYKVDDVIAKPFEPSALLGALERAGVPPRAAHRVVVIDDDVSSRKLVASLLQSIGYDAGCFGDARSALIELSHSTPAAIVLDLLMPNMDGFEFLDAFRATAASTNVPVIVWTTHDLTPQDRARLQATAQVIVDKGRSGREGLVDVLKRVLTV